MAYIYISSAKQFPILKYLLHFWVGREILGSPVNLLMLLVDSQWILQMFENLELLDIPLKESNFMVGNDTIVYLILEITV